MDEYLPSTAYNTGLAAGKGLAKSKPALTDQELEARANSEAERYCPHDKVIRAHYARGYKEGFWRNRPH